MHQSSDIPDEEPTQFFAGSTVKWTRDLSSHYSPAIWTLIYYLRGPTNATIAAGASGSEFSITIAASDTMLYAPGRYKLYGQVNKAAEIFDVYQGDLLVDLAPNNIPEGQDMRSWARICQANLRAAVQGTTDSFILNYSVSGASRTIGKMSAAERQSMLDYFDAKVLQEDQKGKPNNRNIFVRFNKP